MTAPDLRVIDGGADQVANPSTYDIDLEGSVVGNALYQPDLLGDLRQVVEPRHCYSEAHRRILEVAFELHGTGRAVDVVTVATELRERGRLAQVGGMAYLIELGGSLKVYVASHVLDHARRVRELAARRDYAVLGTEMRAHAEHSPAPTPVLVERAQQRLDAIAGVLGGAEAGHRVDAVAKSMIDQVEKLSRGGAKGSGRKWGFPEVDALTAGLHNDLAIVGARPGMGKTGYACAVLEENAGRAVGGYLASIETPKETILLRMACARSGVDVHRARVGALTSGEWSRFTDAAAQLSALPLWIDDTKSLTVAELWARVRRVQLACAREGKVLGLVAVDYLQLVRAPRFGMKREEIVSENARALAAMAGELHVTVVALSQLNREVDKRADKRPQLSDLRESGEIEQAARTVVFLYREDYYGAKKRGYTPTGIVEAHVAKQNNGPTGRVRLRFEGASTRFSSAPDEDTATSSSQTFTCGGCRLRVEAGRSCPCGKTTTPTAPQVDDEAERDEAIDEWMARQPGGGS